MPTISVCIPSYNRPRELAALLESVATQESDDFEVVISDDCSPLRSEILSVVGQARDRRPQLPHVFHRNDRTLGYDANLRRLLGLARGDYCLFMGDDDLLLPGAIERIREVIDNHEDVGVILRAYYSVDRATGTVRDIHRHFAKNRLFPPGPPSVIALFRRSLHISGYAVHRETALSYDTDRLDGTLLYQLHLTANILLDKKGFYISDFQVIDLLSDVWHFGTADVEKDRFAPGHRQPEQCADIVGGMLALADSIEKARGVAVREGIRRDVDHYIYGPLTWQAHSRRGLLRLVGRLWRLGLGRSPHFWATVLLVLLLGRRTEDFARWVKTKARHSRLMGAYYQGIDVPGNSQKGGCAQPVPVGAATVRHSGLH